MTQVHFYCAQDDGTLTTPDGKPVKIVGEPYQGPTVPTFRVNQAIREQPGKNISIGEASNRSYRNADLGLQYVFPQGWRALPQDKTDPPPENASREYQFLHACSQTLLRLVPQPAPGSSYRDGPMIVLRALDYNCLSMRTAVTLADKRPLRRGRCNLRTDGRIRTDRHQPTQNGLGSLVYGLSRDGGHRSAWRRTGATPFPNDLRHWFQQASAGVVVDGAYHR